MSMQAPLEGLLRPPLEWITTAAACMASLIFVTYPSIFLLSDTLIKSIALGLTFFIHIRRTFVQQ